MGTLKSHRLGLKYPPEAGTTMCSLCQESTEKDKAPTSNSVPGMVAQYRRSQMLNTEENLLHECQSTQTPTNEAVWGS